MGKIKVLDEHVANLIAAGEVIERPASVVKELVENSLDAGSSKIVVTIEEGGLQLIRVADNGSGMETDDCETAFFRHATSKIGLGKDLFQIRTLGFRGEALPSIAAVAKVDCVTCSGADGLGRKITIEGGSVKRLQETAAQRGTEMTVRELFYNTPARLKYMKSIQTELGHISDYMYRLALAHPSVAFTLRHNGNTLLQTVGNGDMLQVIAAIYGTGVAKGMLRIQAENADYTLQGYISKPELTRSNRQGMTLVLNGRTIRNYALSNAILEAYHTLLPINRYPIVALQVGMDPSLADVNVHPAKLEVRFSKENELVQFAEEQLRAVLRGQVLIPQAGRPTPKAAVIQEKLELYRPAAVQSDTFPVLKQDPTPADAPLPEPPPVQESHPTTAKSVPYRQQQPMQQEAKPSAAGIAYEKLVDMLPSQEESEAPILPAFPSLEPIGQLHGTYIIAQNEEGLYLIDQHAAHERINYEHYYEKFGKPAEASQQLLVPVTLEFTPAQAETLREKLSLFEHAGVSLEPFGGSTFLVRSLPYWFPAGEEKALVEEMADWLLAEKKSVNLTKLREKAAILCSCKASIKANQSLSIAEIEALLDRLAGCGNPYTCPHGRPIVISFSTYELEKMFKRVM